MSKKNKTYKAKCKEFLENHVDVNCGCGAVGTEHTCPYAEEINGDYLAVCTCCVECTKRCADDI